MSFLKAERKAELDCLYIFTVPNVSDLFMSDLSINRISRRFKSYSKVNPDAVTDELSRANHIAEDFISYWAEKDESFKEISEDLKVRADILTYIREKMLRQKIFFGDFVEPAVKSACLSYFSMKHLRSMIHEAVQSGCKHAKISQKESKYVLLERLEPLVKSLWLDYTSPMHSHLRDILTDMRNMEKAQLKLIQGGNSNG